MKVIAATQINNVLLWKG